MLKNPSLAGTLVIFVCTCYFNTGRQIDLKQLENVFALLHSLFWSKYSVTQTGTPTILKESGQGVEHTARLLPGFPGTPF